MLTTWHPLSTKVGTNFVDKRWLLSEYGSLMDSDHSFFFKSLSITKAYTDWNEIHSVISLLKEQVKKLHTCWRAMFST
jgi:hypothetical protein